MTINLYLGDSLEAMRQMPDKCYDLAIVDPPYGLHKRTSGNGTSARHSLNKFGRHDWDNEIPPVEYFSQLERVSKNRIIWGGNYFPLSQYRCFIVWDKMTYIPTMSRVELAYTSYDTPARYVQINSNQSDRIHPTQKPVALYRWILEHYAHPGDKILDTHLGSGNIAIACHEMGYDLDAWEISEKYYHMATDRLRTHQQQLQLWS